MQLTTATIITALTYLGLEPAEGSPEDNQEILENALSDYDLSLDDYMSEETCFAIGYHRGLGTRPFSDDQVPYTTETQKIKDEEGNVSEQEVAVPVSALELLLQRGFGFGLEARDVSNPPPPSVVYAAFKENAIEPGGFAKWANEIDLSEAKRLGVAVTVGSGKNKITVGAGTPVDVIGETDKDGVPHVIVSYDGMALIIPAPKDAPDVLVSGDTTIAHAKKSRKGAVKESSRGKKKVSAERKPTLRDVIIHVTEGRDGGPGPLQTNGQIASRVHAYAVELGIADKVANYVSKADVHVPYYLGGYKPKKNDDGEYAKAGRSSVDKPLDWVVAAIEARSSFLRTDDSLSFDERVALLPEDIQTRLADREATIELPAEEDAA